MPSTFGSVGSEGELSPKHGGIQRRNTNPDIDPYVKSQEHLLTATHYNPQPTAVPPPIAANAGTLGVRHVLCIIGLPERGKPYIAKRLQAYLSFFHGADVQLFNIADYQKGPAGCDENAEALLDDLRRFMDKRNTTASHNMDVPVPEGLGSVSKVHRRTPSAESRAVMTAEAESSLSARREDSVARREDSQSKRDDNMALLVDEGDRRRKNVDSGKVAIIMSTDSHITFKVSGHPPAFAAPARPPMPPASPSALASLSPRRPSATGEVVRHLQGAPEHSRGAPNDTQRAPNEPKGNTGHAQVSPQGPP